MSENNVERFLEKLADLLGRKLACYGEGNITENLFNALQYFRLENQDRTMWIDAVCINQEDKIERAQEVLLMRDIYSKSELAFVWHGKASPLSRVAFDFLPKLFQRL